jgi:hypothetical protein
MVCGGGLLAWLPKALTYVKSENLSGHLKWPDRFLKMSAQILRHLRLTRGSQCLPANEFLCPRLFQ